jgi:Zn-dependent metalloprotease
MKNQDENTMAELPNNSQNFKTNTDENGGIHIESFIKIFDPDTNEVFIEERA